MEINPTKIKRADIYALDFETTGVDISKDKILVVSLSTPDSNYVWDYRKYPKRYWDALFEELKDKLVIAHNAKFEMNFILRYHGIILNKVWDTMVADQILYNGLGFDNGLYDVIERHLNVVVGNKKEKKELQLSFTKMGDSELTSKQLQYASDDTSYLIDVYKKQYPLIYQNELDKIMELEQQLMPVLCKMEVKGCRIDKAAWSNTITNVWEKERTRYEDLLDVEVEKLHKHNRKIAKRFKPRNRRVEVTFDLFGQSRTNTVISANCFNYGSSAQIIELFKLLGEPVPTVVEKKNGEEVIKATVGEDALNTFLTENPDSKLHDFIRTLIKYREYGKLCSTYGEEFLSKLDSYNYIHTTYGQTFTETGRLSSKNPNLQNIPSLDDAELKELYARYKINAEIRSFFLPDEGDVMITADMSQAEARIAGDHSGEQALIDSVVNGEDLHSKLASISYSIIFGEPVTVTSGDEKIFGYKANTLRKDHKSVLFAKFYKGGAKRIYEILAKYICKFNPPEKHKEISQKISKAFDDALPKLSKYLTSLINLAKKQGYLRSSYLGRIRYFDPEKVYGDAANFPIQGINAEACKIAMIKIDRYLSEGNKGRIVMQVHDEVVCSVRPQYAEEAAKYIQQTMADSLSLFLNMVKGASTVEIANFWKK